MGDLKTMTIGEETGKRDRELPRDIELAKKGAQGGALSPVHSTVGGDVDPDFRGLPQQIRRSEGQYDQGRPARGQS